jgi:hypothetical protein
LEELPAGEEEYPGNSREQENLLNQKDSVKIPGWERISWKTPGFPLERVWSVTSQLGVGKWTGTARIGGDFSNI